MATYKVLQDIEAEDKLIGPLTLRQFVYAGVAAIFLYLSYVFISKGIGVLAAPFLPVALISGFFAFPWGRDQPTEVWALAKVRFLFKPRRRMWSQSGVKEMVTVTAPKKVAVNYTDGLSQSEVRSRLRALADTIDSRGWVIKNANLNISGSSSFGANDSDRLVAASSLPKQSDDSDIQASDDMLDEQNNSAAQRLKGMIDKSSKARRDQIVGGLQNNGTQTPKQTNNYWFLNQPSAPSNIPSNMVTFNTQVIEPGAADSIATATPAATPDEASLVAELDAHKQSASGASSMYGHMHKIQPISAQKPTTRAAQQTSQMPSAANPQTAPLNAASTPVPAPVTPTTQAAILSLANNNDLDVATIAREAERTTSQNEVVIKLH